MFIFQIVYRADGDKIRNFYFFVLRDFSKKKKIKKN